jgi:hypothetical protein
MSTDRSRQQTHCVSKVPRQENLPWPGLKSRDRLSRIVTAAVKAARGARHRELRAERQIARILDNISPEKAMTLFFREISRRGRQIPRIAYNLLDIF